MSQAYAWCQLVTGGHTYFLHFNSQESKPLWELPSQSRKNWDLNVKHILFIGFYPKKTLARKLAQNCGHRNTCEEVAASTVSTLLALDPLHFGGDTS